MKSEYKNCEKVTSVPSEVHMITLSFLPSFKCLSTKVTATLNSEENSICDGLIDLSKVNVFFCIDIFRHLIFKKGLYLINSENEKTLIILNLIKLLVK